MRVMNVILRREDAEGSFATLRMTLVLLALLLFPTIASACPVCFGDPNAPMQKGANNGVWVLLGVIGFVQIGFVALFWSFWRRAKALQRRRESLRVIEGGAH